MFIYVTNCSSTYLFEGVVMNISKGFRNHAIQFSIC